MKVTLAPKLDGGFSANWWPAIGTMLDGSPRRSARIIRLECLPGSTLPGDLEDAGYVIVPTGKGERLLSSAITIRRALGSDRAGERAALLFTSRHQR